MSASVASSSGAGSGSFGGSGGGGGGGPAAPSNEMICPICLELLSNTVIVLDCLHRFCSFCVTTALHLGKKECPTCRKKPVSRRSLRRDEAFDRLISATYPRRDEYEADLDERVRRYKDATLAANMAANGSGVAASDGGGSAASGGDSVISNGGGGAASASEAASDAADVDMILWHHLDSDWSDGDAI